MLTRQSTELSQQYYQRLQNSSIKYATSSGYEDVTYDYLMGQTTSGHITDDFFEQLMTGADNNVPIKTENRMILTNNYGEVVVNDDMARYIALGKETHRGESTLEKTAGAIYQLVYAHRSSSQSQLSALASELNILGDRSQEVIRTMIENGGYKSGGTLYRSTRDSNTYYKSAAAAAKAETDPTAVSSSDRVTPQDGYCYDIQDSSSRSVDIGKMWLGSGFVSTMTTQNAKYLGALVSYFAPIFSAAIQNGMSANTTVTTTPLGSELDAAAGAPATQDFNSATYNGGVKYDGYMYKHKDPSGNVITTDTNGVATLSPGGSGIAANGSFTSSGASISTDMTAYAINYLSNQSENTYVKVTNGTVSRYFYRGNDKTVGTGASQQRYIQVSEVSPESYLSNSSVVVSGNNSYKNATDAAKLQAGFKSGTYQLAMVDDLERGTYKRNTMLNFFTQMNYVVDKTDSSKREELTAWFNAEQDAISEKETYWDAEIQNLSTELTSINTEIDSVKTLKSNAIKSVFDWGSST